MWGIQRKIQKEKSQKENHKIRQRVGDGDGDDLSSTKDQQQEHRWLCRRK